MTAANADGGAIATAMAAIDGKMARGEGTKSGHVTGLG
jgi:hypothetical protein